MPTYRKRGKKWSYRIDLGRDPVTNERLQPTISFNDEFPGGWFKKSDCEKAATAHQFELDNGTYVKVKEIMFVDFAAEWFKHYSRNRKLSTLRVRRDELKRFTKFFKFDKLKDIDKKRYQEFLDDMKVRGIKRKGLEEKGYADNTISGTHSTGSLMFDYAMEFNYIKVNPTTYAVLPKTLKTVEDIENKVEIPKYLEKEELAHFLKTAKERGKRGDYFIFLMLAYSGMRDGEMCVLKKTDFDRETLEVSITKTHFSDKGTIAEYKLLPPKTEGSIRKVELDQIVFDALDEQLAFLNEYKMLHRKSYHNQDFVFANTDMYPGYPLNVAYINKRMKRILKLSKLDMQLTPHNLRHTHTSLCAEAEVPLEDIMNRLGHQDDDTTRLVYMHVTKYRKKQAAKKFGDLMRNL